MKIPVFILSFNRLACLRQLVTWLESTEIAEPIIVDNGSTYRPLLDWLDAMRDTIAIQRFADNYGPYRVWDQRLFAAHTTSEQPFYVVTDPDVVPIADCPTDAISRLVDAWDELRIPKVGLSLRLDAIPDTLPHGAEIRRWEETLQTRGVARRAPNGAEPPGCYDSLLDTTFQVNHRDVLPPSYGSAGIRLAHPYQADHLGWQIDPRRLSEEDRFYWQTASERASTIQGLRNRGVAPT